MSVSFLKYLSVFIITSIIVINIGFEFRKTFVPLKDYAARSELFRSLKAVPVLNAIPIPLPQPYLDGMDWVKYLDQTGETHGNIYLFGSLQRLDNDFTGFKSYYFYAFLYKEPIAIQIFILLTFILYLTGIRKNNFLGNELFLAVPLLFFTIYFNFFFKTQIGIRYFLVAFPFLYVFCGYLVKDWEGFGRKSKIAVSLLLIYLIVSVLSYFPHYIPYFNELVWDRKMAYRILADSNIDWGQNNYCLSKYLQSNPDVKVNPPEPVSGRIAVNVNSLVGVNVDPERYRWLRENFEPVDHVAYSFLIFDIPQEDLDRVLKKYGNPWEDGSMPGK